MKCILYSPSSAALNFPFRLVSTPAIFMLLALSTGVFAAEIPAAEAKTGSNLSIAGDDEPLTDAEFPFIHDPEAWKRMLEDNPLYGHAKTLDELVAGFNDPPAAFRPAPLWVWNDDLQEDELVRQLEEFKAKGYGGVFVHPRPGLITPYLSDRWLKLWRLTADTCRKLDLVPYIYDENSYPSGFAGGLVPEAWPESRQVILRRDLVTADALDRLEVTDRTLALFRVSGEDGAERIRLTVNPDGVTGSVTVSGLSNRRFLWKGDPFEGGVGFRTILNRNCRIDDVRITQSLPGGTTKVLLDDDFERSELGPWWIIETLVPGVKDPSLTARIEDGALVLTHDGSMNDAWIRPDVDEPFEGRTTVFEFTVVERFGQRDCNPALAVGARAFRSDETSGVMLVDITGMDPAFIHGMEKGVWKSGLAEALPASRERSGHPRASDRDSGPAFQRIPLPHLTKGERRAFAELNLTEATYLHYHMGQGGTSPWYGGTFFVDLLKPGVGDTFLDITLGAYDKILNDLYGEVMPACFTDEPHVAGGWTPTLPERFEALHGYDLLAHLPSLHFETGPWRKVRHDFRATVLDLYLGNFVAPYAEACESRGIAFTGHVWEHGWPGVSHGPDVMSFNAFQQMPGIDCLMNRYSEGPHAQFGNWRASMEIKSIANQFGRVRTLCEAYGASGWETTFQDIKRIADWLVVGGVNLINPHLAYYTIRGARKSDHPSSYSYHEPWWEGFGLYGDYTGRICWAAAAGDELCDLLVIEPTTTAWLYDGGASTGADLRAVGEVFQSFVTELAAEGVAYDLGSEPVMARAGSVSKGRLRVGLRDYRTVILPPGLHNLESTTLDLLERFLREGGKILSCVAAPPYENGRPSGRATALRAAAGRQWIDWPKEGKGPNPVLNLPLMEFTAIYNPPILVEAAQPRGGRLYRMVRRLEDGYLLFVVNTSLETGAAGTIHAAARDALWLRAECGAIVRPPFLRQDVHPSGDTGIAFPFRLAPGGSALFVFSFADRESAKNRVLKKTLSRFENDTPALGFRGRTTTTRTGQAGLGQPEPSDPRGEAFRDEGPPRGSERPLSGLHGSRGEGRAARGALPVRRTDPDLPGSRPGSKRMGSRRAVP